MTDYPKDDLAVRGDNARTWGQCTLLEALSFVIWLDQSGDYPREVLWHNFKETGVWHRPRED